MAIHEEVNYNIFPRQDKFLVVEEKIFNHKSEPVAQGYKIQTNEGEIVYLSKGQFHALFKKTLF
jgi:hypothetical protein